MAVVAGATRGAGRGIACMLGEAGATVYCTGRSVRGQPATEGRPETIEETAEMVTADLHDHPGITALALTPGSLRLSTTAEERATHKGFSATPQA